MQLGVEERGGGDEVGGRSGASAAGIGGVYTVRVYQEVQLHQRQPRLLAEFSLDCPPLVDEGAQRGLGHWGDRDTVCELKDMVDGLTAGDTYIKFDLLRDDGTKAATSRAVVHVLGGGGQHGSEL